jgi:hypothetical protein
MIKFTKLDKSPTDYSIQTVTAHGSVIVVHYHTLTNKPEFWGLTYNSVDIESEHDVYDLYVPFGGRLEYTLVSMSGVIAEANKQIQEIVDDVIHCDLDYQRDCERDDKLWNERNA